LDYETLEGLYRIISAWQLGHRSHDHYSRGWERARGIALERKTQGAKKGAEPVSGGGARHLERKESERKTRKVWGITPIVWLGGGRAEKRKEGLPKFWAPRRQKRGTQ